MPYVNEKLPIQSLTFTNEGLRELVTNLLIDGFKVYVFQDSKVSQIFFTEKEGRPGDIGTCSDRYGYLAYATVHRPNKQCGTGFMLEEESTDTTTETARRTCRTIVPTWWREAVPRRWSSFEEKASREILTYREVAFT